MIIQPNWTITDQGPWQLIYNDAFIISLLEVEGITSTQGYIFAGTKEECDAEIIRLNLPWASGFVSPVVDENIVTETVYKLIHYYITGKSHGKEMEPFRRWNHLGDGTI